MLSFRLTVFLVIFLILPRLSNLMRTTDRTVHFAIALLLVIECVCHGSRCGASNLQLTSHLNGNSCEVLIVCSSIDLFDWWILIVVMGGIVGIVDVGIIVCVGAYFNGTENCICVLTAHSNLIGHANRPIRLEHLRVTSGRANSGRDRHAQQVSVPIHLLLPTNSTFTRRCGCGLLVLLIGFAEPE